MHGPKFIGDDHFGRRSRGGDGGANSAGAPESSVPPEGDLLAAVTAAASRAVHLPAATAAPHHEAGVDGTGAAAKRVKVLLHSSLLPEPILTRCALTTQGILQEFRSCISSMGHKVPDVQSLVLYTADGRARILRPEVLADDDMPELAVEPIRATPKKAPAVKDGVRKASGGDERRGRLRSLGKHSRHCPHSADRVRKMHEHLQRPQGVPRSSLYESSVLNFALQYDPALPEKYPKTREMMDVARRMYKEGRAVGAQPVDISRRKLDGPPPERAGLPYSFGSRKFS